MYLLKDKAECLPFTSQQVSIQKSHNILNSIKSSLAFVELSIDGLILDASENFLNTIGYTLGDIIGQHHSFFCDDSYSKSTDYSNFWQRLTLGIPIDNHFLHITKSGKTVWLESNYCPVKGNNNDIISVVKIITRTTVFPEILHKKEDLLPKVVDSIATISFKTNGTIVFANDSFLSLTSYKLEDIQSKLYKILNPSQPIKNNIQTTYSPIIDENEEWVAWLP